MGSYHINNDGSVSQSVEKNINNIVWIDYVQYKGKMSILQILIHILFLFPFFGWLLFVLSWCCIRFIRGYWPFFGIQAIEDTNNPIKIYCNKDGKLGLYAKKHRITSAKFDTIQDIPTNGYPAFIMGSNGQFCIYNCIQGKFLFKGSTKITYLGDKAVLVNLNGKTVKYSLIGMCLE